MRLSTGSGAPRATEQMRSQHRRSAGEGERLDHRASFRPPQKGATRDDRMRDRERQRAAGKWQAISQQPAAELGKETVRASRGTGLVDKPGKRAGRSIELNYVDDIDRATQSVRAGAAMPGVRPRVVPACNRGQAINVMGPTFRMA